jgi:hypothetical protein
MQFEVTKKQRGGQGQWFSYPSRRFATKQEACDYAESFAVEQSGVPGTRIVVVRRKGQQLVRDIKCVDR